LPLTYSQILDYLEKLHKYEQSSLLQASLIDEEIFARISSK